MSDVIIKRDNLDTDTDTDQGRTPSEDWSYAGTSQGATKVRRES